MVWVSAHAEKEQKTIETGKEEALIMMQPCVLMNWQVRTSIPETGEVTE
jgi:hypothetical protein